MRSFLLAVLAECMYCCLLWLVSPTLHALATSSESSPNIAIYEQIDHHYDGNDPTAHYSEDGMGLHVPKEVQHNIDNL